MFRLVGFLVVFGLAALGAHVALTAAAPMQGEFGRLASTTCAACH